MARRQVLLNTYSVTLGSSTQPQQEVDIQNYGNLTALEFEIVTTITGTPTGATTVSKTINSITAKDKNGVTFIQGLPGSDLRPKQLSTSQYFLNKGIAPTDTTIAAGAITGRFVYYIRAGSMYLPGKLAVTVGTTGDLYSGGATAATTVIKVYGIYMDETPMNLIERDSKSAVSVVSGLNNLATVLPKSTQNSPVIVQNIEFSIGTESNFTTLEFSSNGNAELPNQDLGFLIGQDNGTLNSGHVTGYFPIYNSPFVSTDRTILKATCSGSDTINVYTRLVETRGK